MFQKGGQTYTKTPDTCTLLEQEAGIENILACSAQIFGHFFL
jgi:hypothetical protein